MFMNGGTQLLDRIKIQYKNVDTLDILDVFIDVYDNSLSRKWLNSLDHLLKQNFLLEKNYCFLGFVESKRDVNYLLDKINQSILAINSSELGYQIDDTFTVDNTMDEDKRIIHKKLNTLHRYFEELQGSSGNMSKYYVRANKEIKWHIRQLNLLCHEYESLVLSLRKAATAPMWRRPSQLMCWLNAPRFTLDVEDYELFGIETINRQLGGVYVGVNKAVGKHHWEVFNDEGKDSRLGELTTTALRPQTEASGDFDIEWANNPGEFPWQIKQLKEFRQWLLDNNFDPDDKMLTIGHPQVGRVDLERSFGTTEYEKIWKLLGSHLDVHSITINGTTVIYDYHWSDSNFKELQIARMN